MPLTIDRGDNLMERQVKGLSTDEVESIRMERIFEELLLLPFLLEAQPIVDERIS